jgi:hypothetical protein
MDDGGSSLDALPSGKSEVSRRMRFFAFHIPPPWDFGMSRGSGGIPNSHIPGSGIPPPIRDSAGPISAWEIREGYPGTWKSLGILQLLGGIYIQAYCPVKITEGDPSCGNGNGNALKAFHVQVSLTRTAFKDFFENLGSFISFDRSQN